MLKFLPVFAFIAAGAFGYRIGYQRAQEKWQAQWAQYSAKQAQTLARQQAQFRVEEQRRNQAVKEVTDRVEKQLANANRDAADTRSAAQRLHAQLRRYRHDAGASCDTGACGAGASAKTACDMLARLFAQSVARNQQLAAFADDAWRRGRACEASYDALTVR